MKGGVDSYPDRRTDRLRGVSILAVALFAIFAFWGAIGEAQNSQIVLIPDPKFGAGVDWGYYFRSISDRLIGFLSDGSFYIASTSRNKILFCNEKGELRSEFGRAGQGPGDLTSPSDVSILDDRYVVVGEYGSTRRISVFDLQGNFFKMIQATDPLVGCLAFGDGKIAIVTGSLGQNLRKDRVFLRDIHSGQSVNISSFESPIPARSRLQVPDLLPAVHLARIDSDKLLVGFSENAIFSIYSTDGKRLAEFSFDLPRRKAKKSEIENALLRQAEAQKNENIKLAMKKAIREGIETVTIPEFYPAYFKIAVDAQDRILVFSHHWIDGSPIAFHAYSKSGESMGETIIENGDYRPVFPRNFFKDWFYVFLTKTNDEGNITLARIKYLY